MIFPPVSPSLYTEAFYIDPTGFQKLRKKEDHNDFLYVFSSLDHAGNPNYSSKDELIAAMARSRKLSTDWKDFCVKRFDVIYK